MKRLSQSGSSNFCPELRKNALLISQSHFSNFALHVIMFIISITYPSICFPFTGVFRKNGTHIEGFEIHNSERTLHCSSEPSFELHEQVYYICIR